MLQALFTRVPAFALLMAALAGCTVQQTATPDLTGPSEFALSFKVAATPDSISQDGGSQSSIVVSAFGPDGKPRSSVTFRLDMIVDGQPTDYGTLSGKTVVTGADGRATATYTAPPAAPVGAPLPTCSPSIFSATLAGGCVRIVATGIGSGFSTQVTQTVEIHLVPTSTILPAAPTASFTSTPSSPSAATPIQCDASASCAGPLSGTACPVTNQTIVGYAWDFGDGGTATGKVVSHSYTYARTYSVTLTVTNDRGVKASTTRQISVGAGATPTAAFVFSPTPAVVRGQVYFDASASRAGTGHRLVEYRWNWGDGDPVVSSSSPLQDHDFVAAGTYTVVLTVVDEAGQIGTSSQSITVSLAAPGAAFTIAPSPARVGVPVTFDGLTSTTTGGVARYEWWFDLTGVDAAHPAGVRSTTAPTSTITHTYQLAGTYTIQLIVYDRNGQASSAVTHTLVVN
jgi:PKD repeat protein